MLTDSSRNNSCNALMHLRKKDDKHRILLVSVLLAKLLRLLHAVRSHGLTLLVEHDQLIGKLHCHTLILRLKKRKRSLCRIQTARRINTWT